jgi:hypothetical protein
MFHGTSGINAKSIEREGFSRRPDSITHEQLQRVANIYKTMKRAGVSGGGVLKPFSLDHDFVDGERSPLFFAETSLRASWYATHDFSGGEKLRPVGG